MQKYILTVLLCCFLLVGCTLDNEKSASQTAYEGYYKAIEDVNRFNGSSMYYKISTEMTKVSDNNYRYYVFVDEPQCAMYDVVLMAVANDTPLEEGKTMMPSIGIFDSEELNMIPYQSYSDAGFVKGLVISGETDKSEVNLKILVEWHDKTGEKDYREFLSFIVTPEGSHHVDDDEKVIKKHFQTVESPSPTSKSEDKE